MGDIVVTDFKGIRNDRGAKYIGDNYFFDAVNFNYDSFVGADKILFPKRMTSVQYVAGKSIDGIFEFNFTDKNGVAKSEKIVVTGGSIFKGISSPVLIASGLQEGRCTFATYENKLYIANGKNYQKVYDGEVVTEQGAPFAYNDGLGVMNGNYFYAMTYVTSGGEEVIGTVSNVVNLVNGKVKLEMPIGYTGVLQRKIYRTESNGTQLKYLATITNNIDTEYIDNSYDSVLGVNIPAVNNELPKVFFLEVSKNVLVGCVNTKEPTQIYATDGLSDVFDFANFTETSQIANDNTPIVGMKADYDILVIGTQRNIYVLDCEDPAALSLTLTRANVGVKSGYSMMTVPSNEGFNGGVFFASSINDIRLFSGNFAQPVATSLDNLRTENFGQAIKTFLETLISGGSKFASVFFDSKYHLAIDDYTLVFDIRNQSWWLYDFGANCYGLADGFLFRGLRDISFVEKMYSEIEYLGENKNAYFRTADLGSSEFLKFFEAVHIFFTGTEGAKIKVYVTVEDDENNQFTDEFLIDTGAYHYLFYNQNYYDTSQSDDDYRVVYVNRYGRWASVRVECEEGRFLFRGLRIFAKEIPNKELAV